MTDALADHLREHSRAPDPVMPALGRVRARLTVLSSRLQRRTLPGPLVQIICELCGALAMRGHRARYCSPACQRIAGIMRDTTLTAPCEAP